MTLTRSRRRVGRDIGAGAGSRALRLSWARRGLPSGPQGNAARNGAALLPAADATVGAPPPQAAAYCGFTRTTMWFTELSRRRRNGDG